MGLDQDKGVARASGLCAGPQVSYVDERPIGADLMGVEDGI